MRDPETREAEILVGHFVAKATRPITEQRRGKWHRADAGAVIRVDRDRVLVDVTRMDELDAEVACVPPQCLAPIKNDVPMLVVANPLPEFGNRRRRRKSLSRKRPGLLEDIREAERRLGGGGATGDIDEGSAQQQQRDRAPDPSHLPNPFDALQVTRSSRGNDVRARRRRKICTQTKASLVPAGAISTGCESRARSTSG